MRDEVFNDCLEHWQKSDGNTPFWAKLANKYNYESGEQLRGLFKTERNKRGIKKKPVVDSVFSSSSTKNADGTYTSDKLIEMCEAEMKDDVFLLNAHGFDPDRWIIVWAKSNRWHGPTKDGRQILYQSKITVKVKAIEDITIEDIGNMFKKKEFSLPTIKKIAYSPSDEVLEVCITDLHFGSDANHEPEKRFQLAIDDVIERIGNRKFDKIILAVLGDIFHYDGTNKTTTSGTVVSTNGQSAYEVYDLGLSTMLEAVQKFLPISPVEIVFVPGNHDRMSGYTLIKAIEAYYKDVKEITVDSGHSPRKFQKIGVNLVGWMHGDIPKARASNWLQIDARNVWGETKYSEIHSGNFHSQHGKEEGGVVLRYIPGLTDIDQWHNNNGFVGAVRAMVSFVWDKEKGLREQWFTIS